MTPPSLPQALRASTACLLAILGCLPASPADARSDCGNGILDHGEQCDDGGLLDLDGCTHECLYEQVQRIGSLELHGGTAPLFCTPVANGMGGAFSALGLPILNSTLQEAIGAGQFNLLLDLLSLDDASGQNDPDLDVGLLAGVLDPLSPTAGELDSWYLASEELLNNQGRPSQALTPGQLSSLKLTAGPTDILFQFSAGTFEMLQTRLQALVSSSVSLPAPPPDLLAPGLVAFEILDASGVSEGLCGNVTVGSLANIPAPTEVTSGSSSCRSDCSGSRAYVSCGDGTVTPACHSLLDVLVGGCRVQTGCFITLIEPTQPDVGVGPNPPAPLLFAPSGGGIDKVVVIEPKDAYSSWFSLTTQRVHDTNNLGVLFRDGFESGSSERWSNTTP